MAPVQRLWTPQLLPYTADQSLAEQQPFKQAIHKYLYSQERPSRGTIEPTGVGASLWSLLKEELSTEEWVAEVPYTDSNKTHCT